MFPYLQINVVHYINKMIDKNISTNAEKALDKKKNQHPFMIKNSQQSGNKGANLNVILAIYD